MSEQAQSTNLVKYRTDVDDDFAEAEKELAKGGLNFLKPKVGKNRYRPVPAKQGSKAVQVTHEHYLDIEGVETKPRFNCPRLMAKQICMSCDKYDELMSTGNPADAGRAKKFKPRKRVYMNVIDRADPEAGPKVWAFGQMVFEQLSEIKKDREAGGNFFDPSDKGFDLIISRKGTGQNDTRYKCYPSRKNRTLADDANLINEWVQNQTDLSRFAGVPESNEVAEVVAGVAPARRGVPEEEDEFDDADAPSSTADKDAVDAEFTDKAPEKDPLDELDD